MEVADEECFPNLKLADVVLSLVGTLRLDNSIVFAMNAKRIGGLPHILIATTMEPLSEFSP